MKKIIIIVLTMVLAVTQINVFANEDNIDLGNKITEKEYKNSSFIVKYKNINNSKMRMMSDSSNILAYNNMDVIDFDTEKSIDEVKAELNDSNIDYIQPNYMLELTAINEISEVSTDNKLSENINNELNDGVDNEDKSLEKTISSSNKEVVIGLIDSEVDSDNSEIKNYLSDKRFSTIDNSGLSEDELKFEQNHATHLAGIISGKSECLSDYNVNVKIMPLEVFKGNMAKTSDILSAINFAKNNGVDVINMSFGCSEDNIALKETIEEASDIMFVAASGNFRRCIDDKPVYPASYDLPNVISVTSVNRDGGLSYYSDYGEKNVDIAALGKDIESTLPNDERGKLSGTSMSAAVVSRAISILYANKDYNSPSDCKELLLNTADKISSLTGYVKKSAKLNLNNALEDKIIKNVTNITCNDEFSISPEVYDENTAYKLFAASKTVAISAGMAHTIALKEDGTVWAWGDNTYGQLGNGTFVNSPYPVKVKGLTDIVEIVAGGYHNIVRKADNTIWTWGKGDKGQLCSGMSNRSIPTKILPYNTRYRIAAGQNHTIYAYANNIYGFGDNSYGQLCSTTKNTNNVNYFTSAVNIKENSEYAICDVEGIGAGYDTTYFISSNLDGVYPQNSLVFSMGFGNDNGMDGSSPLESNKVMTITCGYNHAFIYNSQGNAYYSYGSGSNNERSYGKGDYTKLSAGNMYTLGIKSDGSAYIWGYNFYNNNSFEKDPSTNHIKLPLNNIVDIAAGCNFAMFLDSNGQVYGMGKNFSGQLGNATLEDSNVPVAIKERTINTDETAVKVASGENHYLALKKDGTVWAWGDNTYGQVGNVSESTVEDPMKIASLSDVVDIQAGCGYSLALKSNGTLWAWGKNDYGQLGNGTNQDSNIPVQVQIDKNVKAISAGYEHALLVTEDKLAYAWGRNDNYQLCNRTNANANVPTLIPNLTYLSSVAAGYDHSVLLKQDGTVYTCGNNTSNKLGGNRTSTNSKPVAVMKDAAAISAGKDHTMILNKNGTVYICGDNTNKKLGLDSAPTDFTAIAGLNNVTDIKSDNYCLAKTLDNKCYIWGLERNSTFFGCSNYVGNKNIKIIDINNVTDMDTCNGDIFVIKNNKIYSRYNTYGDFKDGCFLAPLAWNYEARYPISNGNGTASSPYIINTLEDLYRINCDPNSSYYKLGSNIDMDGEQIHIINNFKGILYGNNKTISNFKIKIPNDNSLYTNVGLFYNLENATIQDLNIDRAEIVGYNDSGVIAGIFNGDLIKNCKITNTTVMCENEGINGGIVGINRSGEILDCTFTQGDLATYSVTKVLTVTKGKTYRCFLTGNNMGKVSSYRYIIEYNPQAITPKKIGENPSNSDASGIIADANITDINNSNGVLSFKIKNDNSSMSGILCPIEFEAKSTGKTGIDIKIGTVF